MKEKNNRYFKNIFKILPICIVVVLSLIGIITVFFSISLLKHFNSLKEIFFTLNAVHENYYQKIDNELILNAIPSFIIEGLGDQYSFYYRKETFNSFMNELYGKYAGIGVVLKNDENKKCIKVYKVYKDSPADLVGVKEGDLFLKIQNKTLNNSSVKKVSECLRGEEGTDVNVTIFRPKDKKEYKFLIKRKIIAIPTVRGQYLKSFNNIFYIEINSFTENTYIELKEIINNLKIKPKKIILDLRNNPGGMVEKALQIGEYFVPKGIIMYEVEKQDRIIIPKNSTGKFFLNSSLIVLVNKKTASSAEILAGAIKDRNSGILIGENTFGKSFVQVVIRTPSGGGIFLTTKRYMLPSKIDINKIGIDPNIKINLTREEEFLKNNIIDSPDEINDTLLRRAINIFIGQ